LEKNKSFGEKMKMLIQGDMDEKKLIKLGKFLVKMYQGKKEHINVMILEGGENLDMKETAKLLEEMWKK